MSKRDELTCRMIAWCEQSLADELIWHGARTGENRHTAEELEAYAAGFKRGWQQAYSTLRLHNEVIS